MTSIRLIGKLVCRDADEAAVVEDNLALHIALTHAEPGCLSFEVVRSTDPLVWDVDEVFNDEGAFCIHQVRAAQSEWGHATAAIERRYTVTGLPPVGE